MSRTQSQKYRGEVDCLTQSRKGRKEQKFQSAKIPNSKQMTKTKISEIPSQLFSNSMFSIFPI